MPCKDFQMCLKTGSVYDERQTYDDGKELQVKEFL